MAQGALTAAGAGEEVVPASEYRALQGQIAELQRLLGKKTMEVEILREAVSRAAGPVSAVAEAPGHQPAAPVCNAQPANSTTARATALPDAELVGDIPALIADLHTYCFCRVHALLGRHAARTGGTARNSKRVCRALKVHGLLPQGHSGRREERRHEGRIASEHPLVL